MVRFSFTQQVVFLVGVCLAVSASAFVVSPPAVRTSSVFATRAAQASSSPAPRTSLSRCRRSSSVVVVRMSEEEGRASEEKGAEEVEQVAQEVQASAVDPAEDSTQSVKSFFAPNENIRRGSSRDQDGKSNVWAVEPRMQVEGEDVESPKGNNLAVTGALLGAFVVAMAATIAFLPNSDLL